jgi:hypothetical protein
MPGESTVSRQTFADELAVDERLETVEGRFRVGVYIPTVDVCVSQMRRRFESLDTVVNNFQFLFPKSLLETSDEELSQMVSVFFTSGDVSDDLTRETLVFRACAMNDIAKARTIVSTK